MVREGIWIKQQVIFLERPLEQISPTIFGLWWTFSLTPFIYVIPNRSIQWRGTNLNSVRPMGLVNNNKQPNLTTNADNIDCSDGSSRSHSPFGSPQMIAPHVLKRIHTVFSVMKEFKRLNVKPSPHHDWLKQLAAYNWQYDRLFFIWFFVDHKGWFVQI